jgi:membrane protease subunit HflC
MKRLVHKTNIIIGSLAILFALIFTSCFTVKETETVFVVEFGKIRRTVTSPGLHLRVPFVQEIAVFDRRIFQVDSAEKEILSLDQKRLIVDAYCKYKIVQPDVFFKTLQNQVNAFSRISSILDSSMRQVVASFPLVALLSADRSKIMSMVLDLVVKQTAAFGIEVKDVRIIRADLPVENSEAIFIRMKTEREKEAKQLRAEGEEEAQVIKARADRSVREMVANAKMEAEIIVGRAEAEAAKIYAKAFSLDREFFNFYTSMNSYRKYFDKDNTSLIMTTKNSFFKELERTDVPSN